jgi:hypothetical protein
MEKQTISTKQYSCSISFFSTLKLAKAIPSLYPMLDVKDTNDCVIAIDWNINRCFIASFNRKTRVISESGLYDLDEFGIRDYMCIANDLVFAYAEQSTKKLKCGKECCYRHYCSMVNEDMAKVMAAQGFQTINYENRDSFDKNLIKQTDGPVLYNR